MEAISVPPTAKKNKDDINPVDLHVGARIRQLRKDKGITQLNLTEAIGLSFQQVQKYETGANRISVSLLYDIAKALEVTVDYFFQGLEDAAPDAPMETRFFSEPGARELAEAFLSTAPALRDGIVQIAKVTSVTSAAMLAETVKAKRPTKAKS